MRPETRTAYIKNGKTWTATYIETDTAAIYKSLNKDLRNRFIHRAAYVTRVTDYCNHDGTRTITVYYNNNVKSVYIVKD